MTERNFFVELCLLLHLLISSRELYSRNRFQTINPANNGGSHLCPPNFLLLYEILDRLDISSNVTKS